MKPVQKVEVGSLDVSDDVLVIDIEKPVTQTIGKFQVLLSEGEAQTFSRYNSIALGDIVKIYLGYDTVPESATFEGLLKLNNPYAARTSGYIRVLSGLDYGEIMFRKHKTKRWDTIDASVIVTELANDLGFGTTQIEADTTDLTYTAPDMLYYDILKDISDIRDKDFYVANNKDLYWFSRQTAGTAATTLKEPDNILSYRIKEDEYRKANKVTVYGAREKAYPSDQEQYTEQDDAETPADDGWTVESGGSLAWNTTEAHIVKGAESLKVTMPSMASLYFTNGLPGVGTLDLNGWKHEGYQAIKFYLKAVNASAEDVEKLEVRAVGPSSGDYFDYELNLSPNVLNSFNVPTGDETVGWTKTGSGDWSSIYAIRWYIEFPSAVDIDVYIDGFHIAYARYKGTASSGASDYEAVFINNDLHSDGECSNFASASLAFLENPINHLDVTIDGDLSIIQGELINVDIASRNINTTYDVINVKHHYENNPIGFLTNVVTSKEKGIRTPAESMNIASLLKTLNEKAILGLRGIQRK